MRILALSPHLSWPLYGGNMVRIYNLMRELARRGHELVFVAGYDGPPLGEEHPIKRLCREVHTYRPPASARRTNPARSALASVFSPLPYTAAKFSGREVPQIIREILNAQRFDLIFANFAFMANLLPVDLARRTPVVLDEHESEGLLWRQYLREGGSGKRAFALLNLAKMGRFQKSVSSRIAALMSASEREAAFARTFLPSRVQLWVVPNGVDTEFFTPATPASEPALVLCAGFSVYRNCEAAVWFVREIFPEVRKAVPETQFSIVGSNPPPEVRQLGETPGVHVTGTVEDIRPYYCRAAVSVAPYRYGEGTKLKVLEAMACGVPVVSTTIGCQGIEAQDGEHLLVADAPLDFAKRIVDLLRDPKRRAEIGARARALIEQKYAWKKIVDDLEPRLLELARGTA